MKKAEIRAISPEVQTLHASLRQGIKPISAFGVGCYCQMNRGVNMRKVVQFEELGVFLLKVGVFVKMNSRTKHVQVRSSAPFSFLLHPRHPRTAQG